jgi:GNAT superfamily N-acetyltransferase
VSVVVRPVSSRRDRREFIELPYRLHSSSGVWVPPLRLERRIFLMRSQNAFFSHGDAQLFLAERDGRVVGRISAQYDDEFNAFHGHRWGMFGFLELEDAPDILPPLLEAATGWLRTHGRDHMVGPMDFTMNDECGLLIDGYELEPYIKQPWHPPYYQARCEEAGLAKAMDLLMWELDISDRENVLPILPQMAERARDKHGIRIRKMSRRGLRRDLDQFAKVYNAAWSHNWGFVPYSKVDLDAYTIDMQLVFSHEWFMIAEQEGRTVAMAITIPDIHQVYKKMQGRLLPLGWLYYLMRHRIIDRVRVGFLGVLPEYQHTGVAAALYLEHFAVAERVRQKEGEASFILEVNSSMNRGLEAMGGRLVKRWRVYERLLEPGAEPSAPTAAEADPPPGAD